ncbi:MAG: biotin-dependent carboxyltransferase family protein [Desulfobacteraceae bacterium]|nr:biotin-dependent carboxyltransferase family protein [Desulfobacteraceae bacterium]
MAALKILFPGGYTTVQDKGRFGLQNMGIPVSGVLDKFAFAMANLLVGNPDTAAVLEITVIGPHFEALKDMDIALTGANMGITVNGTPTEQWKTVRVKKGDKVTIGQIQQGCRAYLAFNGGIDVPLVMDSLSTYVGAKIGGFEGRPLQKEDILKTHDAPLCSKERHIPLDAIPEYPPKKTIRIIPGPQDDYFDNGAEALFSSEYMVTAKANRMGYRLQGEAIPIKTGMPQSIISEPSMPGSIQIPPNGQPIILLVEQTVGGYAKIATIISSDLSQIAQATPGDTIIFEKTDLSMAHAIYKQEKEKIQLIKDCIKQKKV